MGKSARALRAQMAQLLWLEAMDFGGFWGFEEFCMIEILRTLNPVDISYAQALLKDAKIESHLFDAGVSAIEGSISAFPQRLMVIDEDEVEAREILTKAGIETYDGKPF